MKRGDDGPEKKPIIPGAFVELALFFAIIIPVMMFAPWLLIVLIFGYMIYGAITGSGGKGPGQYGRYDGDGDC